MTIADLRDVLPRHVTARWGPRSKPPDCIVIHHSVTPGDFPIGRIADYHISRGYAGIAYHYVVDAAGCVSQCNDDTAFTWHGHDANTGLGLCLLGDFTDTPPPPAQLEAARALVAHLRGRYGPLPVLGHREAGRAQTACPGDTWPQWKPTLTEAQLSTDPFARFPRPAEDTGAGVHGGANGYHPLGDNDGLIPGMLDEMRAMGLRWVKLVDIDGASYNACRMVLERGMMPVVRLYRERPYPGRLTYKQRVAAKDLANLGVRYFERGNEPNLDCEWQQGQWPGHDWNAWTDATFRAIAADWIDDAIYLASLNALVAVDAMAPGGNYDDITFLLRLFAAFKHLGAGHLLRDHCWLSVHNAGLNHPPDYPDDAVNQKEHPGQTIHTHYYRPGEPTGASNCIRKHEAVHRLFLDNFGFELPVLCTEGGFWSGQAADSRYPALTPHTASERQAAELRRMATAPAWLIAQMPWLWFNRLGANLHPGFERDSWKRIPGWGDCPANEPAELPVVAMLKANPCRRRETVVSTPPAVPQPSEPAPGATPVERIRNTIINAIAQDTPIPYNAAAAFPVRARQLTLGAPLTGEHDVDGYRCQGYALAIVYAPIGQWGDIRTLDY